jgi:TatD DNase family protein
LSPIPHRGKTGEPAFVADTARYVAQLRGVDVETLAKETSDNFYSLFSKAVR